MSDLCAPVLATGKDDLFYPKNFLCIFDRIFLLCIEILEFQVFLAIL
jgi:hypothetical protein